MKIKKVRIVQMMPQKVRLQILPQGHIVEVPRRAFERRLDMGLYEVVNPDKLGERCYRIGAD